MRLKVIGGQPTLQLEKAETSRLLDAIYLGRHMATEISSTNAAGSEALTKALDVLQAAVRKFGAKHLEADGTLKLSARQQVVEQSGPAEGAKVAP